ncbi:hypothetical protein C0995_015752 [Termitomyces sp. Mi166|nr:hypothetical protein C0995_015752 [Termitomyces sp. Mi166\
MSEPVVPVSDTTPLLAPPGSTPSVDDSPTSAWSLAEWWKELCTLTRFALPVFVRNDNLTQFLARTSMLEYSLVMIPVISIGHLSTTALAALSLGSMTANVTAFSIVRGFASALDTMLPSAWTSSQPQLVGLWAQRMAVVMMALQIPILVLWFNAYGILVSLQQDPEVSALASLYLRWLSIGLPAYAFNVVSRRYFHAQGLFSVPTGIICVVAPVNALLNYLLVWGPLRIRLGFIGAPVASAISMNLMSLFSMLYGRFYAPRKAWHPLSMRLFSNLAILVRLGIAGACQYASEWWAWEFVALAASLLGPVALAAQSIILTSCLTTSQAPYALSVATTVRIGNLLGAGNAPRASLSYKISIVMALVLSGTTSLMFMIFRTSWPYLFNNDTGEFCIIWKDTYAYGAASEVVMLVASIMPIIAFFQIFDGNVVVTGGVLRARGMQRIGALLNLSSYYVIGILLPADSDTFVPLF